MSSAVGSSLTSRTSGPLLVFGLCAPVEGLPLLAVVVVRPPCGAVAPAVPELGWADWRARAWPAVPVAWAAPWRPARPPDEDVFRVLPAADPPAGAVRLGADWVAPWDDVAEVPLGELLERACVGVESPLGVWTGGVGSGGALTTGFVMVTLGVEMVGVGVVPTVIDGVVEGTVTAGTLTVGTATVAMGTVGIVGAADEDVAGTSSAPHGTRVASTTTSRRRHGRSDQRSPPDLSAAQGLDIALPTAHPSS